MIKLGQRDVVQNAGVCLTIRIRSTASALSVH
jgi:hypothetical protein